MSEFEKLYEEWERSNNGQKEDIFKDRRALTEDQRQKLCEMIYRAFLDIRILGWQGKAEQAADLADAFHEVPSSLWGEDFCLSFFRLLLSSYREKYPEIGTLKYLAMLNEIFKQDEN